MEDLAITIMRERIEAGVDMVRGIAIKNGVDKKLLQDGNFDTDLFIKGVEVGISLFIQKENSRRFSK